MNGWLTIKATNQVVRGGINYTVDSPLVPQPEDTLVSFKLNAPVHPVDAHIERMSRDVSQQWFRDTFFEADADA